MPNLYIFKARPLSESHKLYTKGNSDNEIKIKPEAESVVCWHSTENSWNLRLTCN